MSVPTSPAHAMSPYIAIAELIHTLWSAVCVGNQAPIVKDLFERMDAPIPGDWVMEMSTYHRGARHELTGLGRLIKVVREARTDLPEWDVTRDGPYPERDVWYIQQATTGKLVTWENCMFKASPCDNAGAEWVMDAKRRHGLEQASV